MDWRCTLLTGCGYQIVWLAGPYCRACRNDHDVILKWDGEGWIVL